MSFRDRLATAYCRLYHDAYGLAHPDHQALVMPPCARGYLVADQMLATGLLEPGHQVIYTGPSPKVNAIAGPQTGRGVR